jgi:LytS/YehU family sensor histidine kinase
LGILLTQIFELTEKSAISFREELELLKLYLDLEKLRFRERFKVIFDIDPSVPLDALSLPPLLLQPFAENAIKHAFKDNTPGQELKISAISLNQGVVLSIEDNGIGRLATTAKNTEMSQQGSGVGMGLCADRLQLFNERFNNVSTINIVDLEYQGSPRGTRVELHFSTP